jgi:pentose-5-phosphate-3-epimerase
VTTLGIKLARSILAADFARLGDQVTEAERAGADVPVVGSAIFSGSEGVAAAMRRLRAAVQR